MNPDLDKDLSPPPLILRVDGRTGPVRGSARTRSEKRPRTVVSARLQAAASLLGDDSPQVRRALALEFARSGRPGAAVLRHASYSSDARVRTHARALLDDHEWELGRRRLLSYVARRDVELEAGMWLISGLERSKFDARPYRKALDAMAREVEKRCTPALDPLERGKVLVDYLGLELGYAGDLEAYTSPDNVYLHRTIERKQGLPLTLCALYAGVAQRVGLKTGIVPLPGHVMLRLYGRHTNLIVDPFHGGEARSQESLTHYLAENGLQFDPLWFQSASDRSLLRRQVSNLRNSLSDMGRPGRARKLTTVLNQFDAR
jgi:regulator of sirC expression with transglutaminase-like and TPR domain